MNVTTLLGLDDLPGYLAGHGWIDADLARTIAADGTWRKVLTLTEADLRCLLDAHPPPIAVIDASTPVTVHDGTEPNEKEYTRPAEEEPAPF